MPALILVFFIGVGQQVAAVAAEQVGQLNEGLFDVIGRVGAELAGLVTKHGERVANGGGAEGPVGEQGLQVAYFASNVLQAGGAALQELLLPGFGVVHGRAQGQAGEAVFEGADGGVKVVGRHFLSVEVMGNDVMQPA